MTTENRRSWDPNDPDDMRVADAMFREVKAAPGASRIIPIPTSIRLEKDGHVVERHITIERNGVYFVGPMTIEEAKKAWPELSAQLDRAASIVTSQLATD